MSDQAPIEDFADLYETAPCGYVSLLPDGRIANMNATLAGWLGRDSGELLGRPIHDILSFGGRIAFETHLAPLLRLQGHVHEIALDLLAGDGSKIPTIANAAEKRDDSDGHLFTRLTLFKAVDRRSYERDLLEARDKAEAESELQRQNALLREQFLAVLGHDLRNPIAALDAGLGLLERTGELGERGRAVLAEMRGSVERASALIDDMLDLARGSLGGGLIISRDSQAPLTPVLEQVVAEVRAISTDRRIVTRFAISEPVHCDRNRIGQLAANLLSNAATHGAHDQPIRLEAWTTEDEFRLSVANAGEPIPEDVRAKLFQPFFRGSARPSQNGLGLGLFIASEIAKAHDGMLEVESGPDETRFTFAMPLAPGRAGAETG